MLCRNWIPLIMCSSLYKDWSTHYISFWVSDPLHHSCWLSLFDLASNVTPLALGTWELPGWVQPSWRLTLLNNTLIPDTGHPDTSGGRKSFTMSGILPQLLIKKTKETGLNMDHNFSNTQGRFATFTNYHLYPSNQLFDADIQVCKKKAIRVSPSNHRYEQFCLYIKHQSLLALSTYCSLTLHLMVWGKRIYDDPTAGSNETLLPSY